MAGTTGLEPATSDVTGRRSNQLNYVPAPGRHNPNRVSAPHPPARKGVGGSNWWAISGLNG